jgi:hypothetical protein
MVVTGGIDSGQNPFGYLCFSRVTALSGRGHCSTFDKSADGIAISEGVSVVVLKRLEDAERDGDRIYAVIRGVAGSSDGRGRSMTAPRPEGQIVALRRAYEQAGFSPSTVGLIEAHGTGTVAGDASELASLMELFKDANAVARTCAVGSVKSMIGHTKAAAGVTGLIKAALALHQRVLPPTLNVTDPNPKLLESGSPFYLNTEAQPWAANGAPRRAGVSAFGFGGSNFHAVLEEYRDDIRHSAQTEMARQWPSELFLLDRAGASGAGCRTRNNRSPNFRSALRFHQSRERGLRFGFVCFPFVRPAPGYRRRLVGGVAGTHRGRETSAARKPGFIARCKARHLPRIRPTPRQGRVSIPGSGFAISRHAAGTRGSDARIPRDVRYRRQSASTGERVPVQPDNLSRQHVHRRTENPADERAHRNGCGAARAGCG